MGRLFGMPIQPASQQDVDAAVAARRAAVDLMPFAPGIDQAAADQTIASWRDDLVQMIEAWRAAFNVTYPSNIEFFAELGIVEVFKNPQDFLGKTGLVFAGFGDHDIFPAMVAYESYGIMANKHIAKEVSRLEIGQTVVVKNGTVLAVEGFEGTDKCLARGGELAGKTGGAVAVKVARENHDLRFDIPCLGPQSLDPDRNRGPKRIAEAPGL